jgi:hypothetical protein
MNKQKSQLYINDVRTWLSFFFLVRLIGITNAPLEIGHNWRQALTNMTARNFHENGIDILHPMIDMAGEKTGILGSEFPFFNSLIAIVADVFGYEHWYGRLINLIVSTIGIYFFYKLLRLYLSEKVAFYSSIVLCCSIWFGFSRKIMPDTFSVALVIIGLYFAFSYLNKGKLWRLILFFVFGTLGILCKIPALALLSVLVVVPFLKNTPIHRKSGVIAASIVAFTLVCTWYFYWVPYLVDTYQFELYINKGFRLGWTEIMGMKKDTLEKFYFSAFHSYAALLCFLVGLYYTVKTKSTLLLLAAATYTVVFGLFIIITGDVFPKHSYYIIPFVPLMAIPIGLFLANLPKKYALVLMVGIFIESFANQQHDFFIKDSEKYKLSLEKLVEETIPKDDKIIINGGSSPQSIYFSHRKGWTVETNETLQSNYIDSLTKLGANYLIIDKRASENAIYHYQKARSNVSYDIYKLELNPNLSIGY